MKVSDNMKYIYGEMLLDNGQPRRHTLTVAGVVPDEFTDATGRKTAGFSLKFSETKKLLGVTGITVSRQLIMHLGDDTAGWAGKKICIYPVPSKKSVSGWAVRVAGEGVA